MGTDNMQKLWYNINIIKSRLEPNLAIIYIYDKI